ncbi:S1 family peptidase [Catellatospora aurea]|uniref:S1 family peptidase n=1 Tax=Catellatospora aurea TaxID=1337874 RepID=A0ABW2H7F6_9ACTN
MDVTHQHRIRRAGLLLSSTIIAAGLGIFSAGPANAVANSEIVPNGQYEFAVKLTMTGIPTADGGRRNSACSGALIAPQWIVTAGHCFRDFNGVRVERPVADLTTATVGRADLTTDIGHVATVIAVRQSPTTDLALAKLSFPIKGIKPLALSRKAPNVGDVLRITGFGSVTSSSPVPSPQLRTGQVTVVAVTAPSVGVTGLAPSPDTSACPYDSGAPYFTEHGKGHPTLVSVESGGPSCPHSLEERTSRVDNIADWIKQIIRG